MMDDRDWARLEARLSLLEAALGLRPESAEVEREADLILKGRMLGWEPGMAMPVRTGGLPDSTARWLAGVVGDDEDGGLAQGPTGVE
jgi:hypothetical protein